jgi:uncharacterized protein (TIGR02145 family)
MRNCIFIFLFILFALAVEAQTVRNVKATQEGQNIAISYELICAQPTEINLFLSEDNGQTWNAVKTAVSGDVGSRITQGSKVIYWDVLQSKEKLVGNAFVFKVKVKESIEEIKSVRIGYKIWMAENLNVDHYRNGDPIVERKDPGQWSSLNSGAWCYYNNNLGNGKIYGKLYNWYAVNDSRGICPQGWHIPSRDDWQNLERDLGGVEDAGVKLSSSTGFNAVFGGLRNNNGYFNGLDSYGYWWSRTEYANYYSKESYYRSLSIDRASLYEGIELKSYGFSVRCIKD